jgi:hypothetical protein
LLKRNSYFSETLAAEACAALDLQQELEVVADLSQEAAVLVQAFGASLLTVLASADADLLQVLVSLLTVLASADAAAVLDLQHVLEASLLQAAVDLVQVLVVAEASFAAALGHCA